MVFVLGGALGVALLVIAFLLGRESSRTPEEESPSADANTLLPPSEAGDPSAAFAGTNPERQWPEWADLDEWQPSEAEAQPAPTYGGRIETGPDGRILLSNRNLDGSSHTPTATPSSPRSTSPSVEASSSSGTNGGGVASYFQRVDAIRSSSAAVDPNAFAMDLIKATMNGSTDGFDELIDDTKRMRTEMAAIEAPPECQAYHQESLAALDESQAILETMKTAIQKGDMQALTRVTQQASALQARADTLEALRKQIVANARR